MFLSVARSSNTPPVRAEFIGRFLLLMRLCFFVALAAGFGGARAADLSRHETLFLQHVAEDGLAELEASKLAADRSSSPEVQKFAQAMAADQQTILVELRLLALAKGVSLPEVSSKMQQASIFRLSKLVGARFDREYSREIAILAHKDMVASFDQAQKRAKDADVKAFAMKFLPMLTQNLETGQRLKVLVDKKRNVRG